MGKWGLVDVEPEIPVHSHGNGRNPLLLQVHPFSDLAHGVVLVAENASS